MVAWIGRGLGVCRLCRFFLHAGSFVHTQVVAAAQTTKFLVLWAMLMLRLYYYAFVCDRRGVHLCLRTGTDC
ncbi:hypothetical protein EDC01DRAFT_641919 [Geopyxis carbonaria]|nr:hypothetical protein EDC01DRAFT_641919 [Geopyxis carbonaria]